MGQGQRIVTSSNTINLPIQEKVLQSISGDFVPVSLQNKAPRLTNQEGSVSSATEHSREDSQSESMEALEGLSIDTNGYDAQSDEICAAELRKLDQDFENNLKRAKKVFVNRMDNLQRTLVQHQKDRVAFEKRLQQEEIEQNRRIEQMQKEWDRRREEVRLKE